MLEVTIYCMTPDPWPPPQLEESEFTCAAAVKTRKSMELEMEDLHLQIDDVTKAKSSVRGHTPLSPLVSPPHFSKCGGSWDSQEGAKTYKKPLSTLSPPQRAVSI